VNVELAIKMRGQDFAAYDLSAVDFDLVEAHVHFADREDYEPILAELKKRGIRAGVHYDWPIDGEVLPSFAVEDRELRKRTIADLERAIDWCADRSAEYLVYHAGPRRAWRLPRQTQRLEPMGQETAADQSAAMFLAEGERLAELAARKGVQLAVESETDHKPIDFSRGPHPTELIQLGEQSPETILALAARGAPICVDFANLTTAFAAPDGSSTADGLHQRMLDFCARVMPSDRLVVHVVGVDPPYVRDTRSGLTDFECEDGVYPDRERTKELLRALAAHPRAVILPEGNPSNATWHNGLLRGMLAELGLR
jgi:sugar phosphate isomerase/epimerase